MLATSAPVFMLFDLNLRVIRSTDQQHDQEFADYVGLRFLCLVIAVVVTWSIVMVLYPSLIAVLAGITLFRVGDSISNLAFGGYQRMHAADRIGKTLTAKGIVCLVLLAVVVPLTKSAAWSAAAMGLVSIGFALFSDLPSAWKLNQPGTPFTATRVITALRSPAKWRIAQRALPLGLDAFVSSLSLNVPRYCIDAWLGRETLGIFGVLAQLAFSIQLLVGALGHTGVSVLADRFKRNDQRAFWRLFHGMVWTSLAVGLIATVGGTIVLPPMLGWALGPEYHHVLLTMLLLVASTMAGVQRTAGRATQACGSYFAYTMLDVVIFSATAAGSLLLIQSMGMIGGAISLIVGFAFGLVATLAHARFRLWNSQIAGRGSFEKMVQPRVCDSSESIIGSKWFQIPVTRPLVFMSASANQPPRVFLSAPHMSGRELEYVKQAFESNYIAPAGPQLSRFEDLFCELTGFKHCVAVASGTAGIQVALKSLGVQPGQVVLASTLTFIGSVAAPHHLGAELILVDSDQETWNMDPVLLDSEIERLLASGKTIGAVLPTELYGQCCDLDRIKAICDPYGIPVLCDSAESLGATYRQLPAGRLADAAVFSFNGNKILTTSGGGMVASDDRELIDHCRYLSTQARQPVLHYEHVDVGYNYRMSNIVAAIGIGQLEVLDQRVEKKREINRWYRDRLDGVPGISFMPESNYGQSNCWLTVIQIDPATFGASHHQVIEALERENIESRPVWKPMHLQPAFKHIRCVGGTVAESLFSKGSLPPQWHNHAAARYRPGMFDFTGTITR